MRIMHALARTGLIAAAVLLPAGLARPAQATPAASAPRGARPAVPQDTGQAAAPCPEITKDLVGQGKKLFTGSGNCFTCHGANAKGTPLAPDLTDKTWLQIDGSYPAIVKLIHTGVPQPKEHPAPMPAMGGAQLSESQICAVGAYVFSLTHPIS